MSADGLRLAVVTALVLAACGDPSSGDPRGRAESGSPDAGHVTPDAGLLDQAAPVGDQDSGTGNQDSATPDAGHATPDGSVPDAGEPIGTEDSGTSDAGHAAPTAAFTFSPAAPVIGEAVSFDASASSCFATPCTFTWTDEPPGGSVYALGNGQTFSFTFQRAGTKYVNLEVTDARGQSARVQHDVVVSADNPPDDTTPPSISISTPASGATVSGTVVVSGSAADNVAVSRVEIQIDSGAFTTASGTTSWSYNWNTASLANGSHTITARATDASNNTRTASVGVTVSNNTSVNQATEVTQFGITWKFDKAYPVGQFINGDWWVVGPVTVVSVTPGPSPAPANEVNNLGTNGWGDTGLRDDKTRRNGSMVVLTPSSSQGYDSRGITYSASASITFPYALGTNRSLISSVSNVVVPNQVMHHAIMWTAEKNAHNVLKTAAVLTCLPQAPPADAFRPAYAGTEKRIFRASSLRWDRLRSLTVSSGVPTWSQYERYLERPWIDHLNGSWVGQWLLPIENQPAYGREFARIVGTASLMLNLNVPQAQKQTLLYRLVQYGIDVRGIAQVGGYWNEGGGHTSGRKWPVLFAGLMLNDPYFTSMPSSAIFHEDVQTYWGNGWHGHTALWQMIMHHGTRQPYEHKQPSTWDSWDNTSESYRVCCNAKSWIGEGLAALLMGAKSQWDHNVFFAVLDDWMRQEDIYASQRGGRTRPSQERSSFDAFVDAFWQAHRSGSVPAQPDGTSSRMWDVNRSGSDKWVPNPRP